MNAKLTKEQRQEIVDRFKAGETITNLAGEMGVSYEHVSMMCKRVLGKDYKATLKANHAYTRTKAPRLNKQFLKIAALIAKGTTLNEIASETGNSMQYVRWWCKEKLSEKVFNQLIENRKENRNDRKA